MVKKHRFSGVFFDVANISLPTLYLNYVKFNVDRETLNI